MTDSPDAPAERGAFAFVSHQPYVLLTITMLLWSSNIILARAVVETVPPIAFAVLRWSFAILILLPFAYRHVKRDLPALRASWPIVALLGFLGIGAYNTLVYIGVHTTSAVNAAVLSSIFPILIAAVGFVIFRDRLTLAQTIGILGSCVGALVILSKGDLSILTSFHFATGDLWILAAQTIYASYTVLLRLRPKAHPLSFLLATMVFGELMLIPFAIGEGLSGQIVTLDLSTIGAALYVAVFPALIAFICFNRGVALIGSNRASPFFHLIPVFGSLMALGFLGEYVGLYHVVGWVMILAGIGAGQLGRRTGATLKR
ncbi:DMT family transporter [Acuticoccus sp. M5D2P5]|uniref:DMT family transporter n=1 Tax=Acuticoccus kalidii TaxID=2910977 RepID=UPI001F347E05|nr:DMT family transporter [Acuticoccus kalidii]MCF3933477.1 DMT family transporter [Acuticoccus kalidii]